MKKHGIAIDCARCKFIASQSEGRFAVTVPVTDESSGLAGQATLHCQVSSQAHCVELSKLDSRETPVIEAGSGLDQRLASALDYVAKKRLCGNRSLCPAEVVSVVEMASRADKP